MYNHIYECFVGKSGFVALADDGAGDAMEGEDDDGTVETEDGAEDAEQAVTETEKVQYGYRLLVKNLVSTVSTPAMYLVSCIHVLFLLETFWCYNLGRFFQHR